MSLLDRLLIAVVLVTALWWACARHRRPSVLARLSAVAVALAAVGPRRLLAGLRAGGDMITVRGSAHMSFSDAPSHWTPVGRKLLGSAVGTGSVALADTTRTTADAITAFAGPVLGIAAAPTMAHVLTQRASLHLERRVAATGA